LITTTKVKNGELKEFVDAFPEIFEDNEDADFSLLAIFLLREKIKGTSQIQKISLNLLKEVNLITSLSSTLLTIMLSFYTGTKISSKSWKILTSRKRFFPLKIRVY